MYSEEFYRIALQYVEGYGYATLKKMLKLSGSATNLFEQPQLWRSSMTRRCQKLPNPTISDAVRRAVDEELFYMQKHAIHSCFYLDTNYPYRLRSCSDGPIYFYYKGNGAFNMPHIMAVVGTREATEYGRKATQKILSDLKATDVITVSGLAYGIDTEAHIRSLELGLCTIAVLGSGLGTIYPSQNKELAEQIVAQGGTLLSEYNFSVPPDRINFPRRNRIIAGLSDAVLVVQTAQKGGSMITAYIAHSYNRDIFAIPGSIFDKYSEGCHELIKKNMAAAVTSGNDLLEMMNWEVRKKNVQTSMFIELNEQEQQVVDLLKSEKEMSIDVLSEVLSEFSPSKLAGVLLGLELKGIICCKPGKIYTINQ